MSLPDEMVARLVCPVTCTPLRRDGEWLVSDAAGLAFPIVRGVPRLVPEQARPTA